MGRLPLLAPMSEVAGRMSIQAGAQTLEKSHGGRGLLLGGVPGVELLKSLSLVVVSLVQTQLVWLLAFAQTSQFLTAT